MRLSQRDWETRLHNAIHLADKADERADDLEHAINLLLNGSFAKFYTALTENGALHEFLIGTARNVPLKERLSNLMRLGDVENRRIILWKTTFEPRGVFATCYSEEDFKSMVSKFPPEELELPRLVETAIVSIPNQP